MKKLLSFFLALITLVSISACSQSKPPQLEEETKSHPEYPSVEGFETVEGSYAYHNLLNDSSDGVSVGYKSHTTLLHDHTYYVYNGKGIIKYDIISGEAMVACSDPGCTHHSEGCISYQLPPADGPFGTVILQFIVDNSLYFSIGGKLYKYSFEKSELSLFLDLSENDKSISATPWGDYIYLTRRIFDEENEEYINSIARVHKNTKKIETLATMKNNAILSFISGDRLYLYENSRTVYSTDMDYKDRQDVVDVDWLWRFCLVDNKLIYSAITEFTDQHMMRSITIYSKDLKTGEEKIVCDDKLFMYYVTDNYIYYLPKENENESKNIELWRINHNGENKTKIITIKKPELSEFAFERFYVDGDYMIAYNFRNGVDYCYDLINDSFTMLGTKIWYK